ncbi:type I-B CRISPR-associated protein Cas5b [Terrisporobacter petrolearius]|uniref:type I-B CRISPR-associated protein Cas5b n=1 Tax=Terrisporobacter petrolearius TaxID=1460447 RepID=UPI001D168140|nr:type I-B CRISPR-associated protein Cas5b [Terrisporobacter petrolearius]MCC3866132.1 type I-B CRISPR-associated protein Cas5b [Terrisporobacter petrolearius]
MKALKFKLSGKTAFFKKPEVNSYYYFTYGNIHKVALLGMFGAILGYSGYNQHRYMLDNIKGYKESYPEFYTKLKGLKISVEPLNEKAYISKKVQFFNNSIGDYNKDKDKNLCNLIVKEQWLENPQWNIYVILDNEEADKLCDYITNYKTIYQPYLGKNDHYANISEIEVHDIENISYKNINKVHSLCPKKYIEFDMEDDEEEDLFKYSERLPVALNENTNMYELKSFVFSNMRIDSITASDLYKINEKNIAFF